MATSGDASEVLRIAALMFEAIGAPVDEQWPEAARSHLARRLGDDVAVFVELHATPPGEPLYRALGFDSPAGPSLRRFRERPYPR